MVFFLRLLLFTMIFARAATADTYVCKLKPDGLSALLLDQVEFWLNTDTWQGELRDATKRTVTSKPIAAEVTAPKLDRWHFFGKLTDVTIKGEPGIFYTFRYRLNSENLTVTHDGTYAAGSISHRMNTAARGTCRKTG